MTANTNTKQVNYSIRPATYSAETNNELAGYYARSATYSANRHLESVISQLTNAANDLRRIQAQVNDDDVSISRKIAELQNATSILSNILGAAGFTQLAMVQVEFAKAESKIESFLSESQED